jgi:SAM-dependent methyltransferase
MPDSASGYVTDAGYAATFFRELSPAWLNYVAVCNSVAPRDLDRPFTYLELGCGFGGSTVVNAAAFPHGEFHACDLNREHIEGASCHARALGVDNARFHTSAFESLPLQDLPTFDFIVLHGVYSWVSREARAATLRILRERLATGGLAYVSYNCWPGWALEAPLRRLLLELATDAGGGTRERVEHALAELSRLQGHKLRYLANNAQVASAIEAYRKGGANYLAHEFFNDTWEPFYSIDVAADMSRADLSYVGSATLADNYPMLLIDDATTRAIAQLPDPRRQQLAMDFAVDRRFRRDVFVRGAERLDTAQALCNRLAFALGCSGDPTDLVVKVRVPRGEISFQPAFIDQLRDLLRAGSIATGDAITSLSGAGRDPAEIGRNLAFLVAAGSLLPHARVHRVAGANARQPVSSLVARALARAAERGSAEAIPSETLGNGVLVSPLEAVGLTQWLAGVEGVEALAARLYSATDLLNVPDSHGKDATRRHDMSHSTAVRVIEKLVPTFVRLGLIV